MLMPMLQYVQYHPARCKMPILASGFLNRQGTSHDKCSTSFILVLHGLFLFQGLYLAISRISCFVFCTTFSPCSLDLRLFGSGWLVGVEEVVEWDPADSEA